MYFGLGLLLGRAQSLVVRRQRYDASGFPVARGDGPWRLAMQVDQGRVTISVSLPVHSC